MTNHRTDRNSAHVPVSRDQVSRDTETREAMDYDALLLDDSGPLPNIPARPGYAQRWVRVALKNDADARNVSLMSRRGWTPRQADTVEKSYQYMLTQHQGLGGTIGTHDLVLMERPIEIQKRAEQIEREKVRNLEIAIKRNLFREHSNMGGTNAGFTAPTDESRSRVIRGEPRIASD